MPKNYTGGLVNIVGVNNLGGAARPLQGGQYSPGNGVLARPINQPQFNQIQDITDEKFAQIRADTERQYQSVLEGLQAKSQIRVSQLQNKGAPQRMGELAQVFGTLSEAALGYVQVQNQNKLAREQAAQEWQKQQLEIQQKEQEKQGLVARTALEEIFLNSGERIRQYGLEQGAATTRMDMERVLKEFGDLPPSVLEPLWQFAGTQMREIESQLTSRTFEQADELQRNQTAQAEAMFKVKLASDLSVLTNPMLSQQQSDVVIGDSMRWLSEQTANFDPSARMQIMTSVLEQVAQRLGEGSQGRVQLEQRINDMSQAFNYVETVLRPQYGDDPLKFQYAVWALGAQYPSIAEMLNTIPDNQELYRDMASFDEVQSGYRQRRIEEQISQMGINGNEMAHGAELGWRLMQNDLPAQSELIRLQRTPEAQRTPSQALALSLYQGWTDARTQYGQLREQLRQAIDTSQGLYLKFTAANRPQETTYVDNTTQPPRAYRLLVEDGTGGAVYIQEGATEEQLRVAQERVADTIYQINDLRTTIANQGFNLDNPGDRTTVDGIIRDAQARAAAEERGAPLNNRLRQEIGLPGTRPRGTSPSGFNPASSAYPLGFQSGDAPVQNMARLNGTVIPFASNYEGQVTISSEYGNRVHPVYGEVRAHHGVDMAGEVLYQRDVGAVTPAGGRVLSAEEWDGYGGTVMIETPEGYIEQYSHLRSFNVQPGQDIRPGQWVGVIGGDSSDPMPGTSTGRHLHFQVWQPGTQDFIDPDTSTLDPLAYLSTINTYENQPIGVGQVQTPTAPTYAPSPDSLGVGGGNWVAGAQGGDYPFLQNFMSSVRLPAETMYGRPRVQQTQQSGDYKNRAVGLLRQFEGFSETAYWDVNAFRVGYGSDTIGGTGTPVNEGTTTTREEAERDLLVRLGGFENTIRSQVGDSFDRLPDTTKAALLSMAYNYGSLPSNVVAAVGTGNPSEIAAAIEARAGDDNGINADRRRQEAEVARSAGYTAPNPVPQALAPNQRAAYPMPNNRNNNYGYKIVADTPSLAYAIANTSNEVGIPGQWLADVLALVSNNTFTPSQVSQYSNAAEVITNVTLPLLRQFKGQINTIEQLYEVMTTGTLTGVVDNPDDLLRLGNGVGRRYRTTNSTLQSALGITHESYVSTCPTCQQMMNRFGTIIPHEALG